MASVKDFSVEEKLVNLYRLQRIDSSIDQIEILRGELPIEVKDLEDEVQGLHNRQLRIEEEINGISEFIEDKKNAIKQSQELLAKYQQQSDNVKNNREYEAINKEIEMQGLEVKLAEKHIRDANEELAEKVKVLDAAKKTIATKEGVLNHKKEDFPNAFKHQSEILSLPIYPEMSRLQIEKVIEMVIEFYNNKKDNSFYL